MSSLRGGYFAFPLMEEAHASALADDCQHGLRTYYMIGCVCREKASSLVVAMRYFHYWFVYTEQEVMQILLFIAFRELRASGTRMYEKSCAYVTRDTSVSIPVSH